MAINFAILIVYRSEISDLSECKGIHKLLTSMSNVKITNVTIASPVENIIMKKLFCACDVNKDDVIVITGGAGYLERSLVIKMIETVSDKEVSEKTARLISKLETKLNETMPHGTVCGIRNKTLIINLFGPYENPKKCFKTVADMILYTVHVMREDKNQNIILRDDIESLSFIDNDSRDQRKVNVCKRRRSCSPLESLFADQNDSAIKRYKGSFPMISIADALEIIHEITCYSIRERDLETVELHHACGRVLCETVESSRNVPPFRVSTKHGYPILVTDGKDLRKVLNVNNTFPLMSLEPGTCVWVKTGGPVPDGATAVVQMKDTKLAEIFGNNDDVYIEIMVQSKDGQNIKPVGFDVAKGRIIGNVFTHISPETIGLLAASGCKKVVVAKHLSIGVLSIGDNLEEPGEPLKRGYVYDVNRITLISLLKDKGFHPMDFGIVTDKLEPIRNKIGKILYSVDALVTTGSINDEDLLKIILEKYYNAVIHFGNVNMKPGNLTTLATCEIYDKKKYILCLPGNPIKAPYILYPRPTLAWTFLQWPDGEDFARASSTGNFISDNLSSSTDSNALLMLPEKMETLSEVLPALLVNFPKRLNCVDSAQLPYSP